MDARRVAFVYVLNLTISDAELLVVLLIPLVVAVWSEKSGQFIIHLLK